MKILSYRNSINSNRKWALFAAYGCLILFVIFFLFPPYYMLITSLKTNKEIAELARQHNNANVLTMPARFISFEEVKEITSIFLNTDFEGGRHEGRVNKISCF